MNWNKYARLPKEYAALPSPYIIDLPAIYGKQRDRQTPNNDLDVQVVAANIAGIVTLCGASVSFKTDDIFMQAGLFAGRYGKTCTLFALAVYFATYMTDWKSQYTSAFDPRDILQQFPNFLNRWQQMEHEAREGKRERQAEHPEPYTGLKAQGIYYRGLMARGISEADILTFEGGRQDEKGLHAAIDACTYEEYAGCYTSDERLRSTLDQVTDRIREIQINAL